MFSSTMSVTTFALPASLEDGAYSKEENIFKIEAASSACPLASSCSFKAPLGKPGGGCSSSPTQPRKGPGGTFTKRDRPRSWVPCKCFNFQGKVSEGLPCTPFIKWGAPF